MKLKRTHIPLLLGIAIAMGVFIGSKLNFNDTNEKIFATNSKKDKLNRLIDYIDYEYVDDVNTDSIVDLTVNRILEKLDPHSVYIPVDEYQDNADDMRGNFTGIGISFYVHQDSIAVIRPIEGGPAAKAGIKAGDRIIAADGKALYGNTLVRDSISEYLKGEKNSKVSLKVHRKTTGETFDVSVRRKDVPLVSIDASYKLTDEVGYIKVNRFAETTSDEFDTSLNDLIDDGIKTLVLDLRGNPGGYIATAEQMADEFLKDDTLIVVTKNKNGEEEKTFATRRGDFENGNVYVLIDENSASASEILAGALQDNDKGTIVGRRSFGKGLVQREMALGDGSAVRLTIARYYTPTGRSIQRPYGNGNKEYFNEYESRYLNGELINSDSIIVADSLKFKTPGGKLVYGGGGITPDVFIPKDTSVESETLNYVSRSGSMSYFVFEYLDKNRNDFDDISFSEFVPSFEVTDAMAKNFVTYISGISGFNINLDSKQEELKLAIKATIAEQLFGSDAYQRILNQDDPMLKKVLDIEYKNLEKILD